MQLLAMLGTAAFVLVGVFVGARMLMLARRSRQLPELFLGGSLFFYAALGQPAVAASRPIAEAFGHEARLAAIGIGLLGNVIAMLGLYLFTWQVYHPGSRVAGLMPVLSGTFGVGSGIAVLATVPETIGPMTLGTRLGVACLSVNFGAGMAWTAWESLRYHAMMRRRLALGLADPVVVNRFLVWGIGCATAALSSFVMIGFVAAGANVAFDPLPLLLISAAGTTIACCWLLSFVPPAGYLRWLGSRASA